MEEGANIIAESSIRSHGDVQSSLFSYSIGGLVAGQACRTQRISLPSEGATVGQESHSRLGVHVNSC
jgi:hypothetical protein